MFFWQDPPGSEGRRHAHLRIKLLPGGARRMIVAFLHGPSSAAPTCSLPVCPFSGRLCIRNSRPRGIYSRSGRAFYRVGWLSVTGIWGLHTFSPRALAREALSMASAGAAGSVLLRQSRGKRPSRWRVITPGARRGTDTPGRVRPSHCSGAAGANSNHSC